MSSEVKEPSCSNPRNKNKRKYTSYDIIEKLTILKELDNSTLSISDFSRKQGIDSRTIRKWKQQRSKLEEMAKNYPAMQRKRQRKLLYENVDKALAIWFAEIRKRSIPINGPIIQAKAMELAKEMNVSENFVASDGWLSKWKTRYGIRSLAFCSERNDADVVAAQKFKKFVGEDMEGFTLAQIFNADETELYYKMLPNRTLVGSKEHEACRYKQSKDRITIMVCSNADGSFKLPLVVIGKLTIPKKLKNVSKVSFPVYYTVQKSAWMKVYIFEKWYREEFIPKVTKFLEEKQLPLKAILFLDTAPCHPSSEKLSTDKIKIRYLPPNITSIVQPMDQGIIEVLKRHYKSQFMRELLNMQKSDNTSVMQFMKSISIEDIIDWISAAWNFVQPDVIKKCWRKLLPSTFFIAKEEEPERITFDVTEDLLKDICQLDGYQNISKNDVDQWISKNDNISLPLPSNDDIIQIIKEENESESESEEKDVTPQQALSAAKTLIAYYKKKRSLIPSEFAVLEKCQNDIMHTIKYKVI